MAEIVTPDTNAAAVRFARPTSGSARWRRRGRPRRGPKPAITAKQSIHLGFGKGCVAVDTAAHWHQGVQTRDRVKGTAVPAAAAAGADSRGG